MKLGDGVSRKSGDLRPARFSGTGLPPGMTPLPLEWMDPMSWRLPSGKALAEFALQAGFLAPLLLNGPAGIGRAGIRRGKVTPGVGSWKAGRFEPDEHKR